MSIKRELGSYYTKGNPFVFEAFKNWAESANLYGIDSVRVLEPFAGSGDICRLTNEAGFYNLDFDKFDIDKKLVDVTHNDSIANFPRGYGVVITNPPYLAQNNVKRHGFKVDVGGFGGYQNLYQSALSLALKNCDYVAMIIPESFITSGLFTERLQSVISLPFKMFDDTEVPTCLALFGKTVSADFEIWSGDTFLGSQSELAGKLSETACSSRIRFNVASGNVGLKAIDNTGEPSIRFCLTNEIDSSKVRVSARHSTIIQVAGLEDVGRFIEVSNRLLNEWRQKTCDVELTAFMGVRKDGKFRRRLDFKNARKIASLALCEIENCKH